VPSQPAVDPYVGPQPFRRADSTRFFGRDEVTDELLSLVLSSRVIILYAQSGTGKSSIVSAGLRPLLERNGFEILPTARVQGGLPAGKTALQLGNPYVYFTLACWGEQAPDAAAAGAMSAALAKLPRSTDRYGDSAYRLLVFDQFEELFTSFPACWAQRSQFVTELVGCVVSDERLRVLLVVREDHLADVLSLAEAFPSNLRSRMRLPLLEKEAAVEAIEGPLRGTGFCYADGVASQLVEDLSRVRVEISPGEIVEVPGGSVEPVQLQVVCTELWRALPSGTTVITSEHVGSHGDTTAALAHYYNNAVSAAARQVKIDCVFIRRWISAQLTTSANTRGTAHRGILLTAGLPNPAIDALEDRHVIRAETRAGSRWYELTHDRFLRPIEEANARAIRRARLGYGVAAVAVFIIALLFTQFWPHGWLDVVLRIAAASIATAGFVQVSWTLSRRRLKYWLAFESRRMRTRLAAVARKTPVFLIVAALWLSCLSGAGNLIFGNVCGSPAITVLYRNSGYAAACLQESSTRFDWGLAIGSLVLAAAVTFIGTQLSRRLAVRRWRRAAGARMSAENAPAWAVPSPVADPAISAYEAGDNGHAARNDSITATPG
jgi:hypothetical protein